MIRTLKHRGPDATNFYLDDRAALGHARLSIIDLAGGSQPMSNEDGSLWITFNGEIFNYLEIRDDLQKRGYRFVSNSDTEVLLRLFEDKGEQCVNDLNGQWAFAIWNSKTRRLFLSRDRMGVRPLFYTRCAGSFLFASEIKALFEHPDVSRELDLVALDDIFTFWSSLQPRTAFRDIFELPPGHSMSVYNGHLESSKYWELDYSPAPVRNESECAEELLALLKSATQLRLRSDVPVGAYLSGGLDSTITTALIHSSGPRLRTFSIGFDEAAFDESGFQQEASRFFGTEHEEVRCSTGDIERVFPQVIAHTEKPVLRTAPAPMFLLSQRVRDKGFKVVLTGEGADEMFGGYDIFKEAKVRQFWAAQPHSRLRPLLLRKLYPYLPNIQKQSDAYLRSFFGVESKSSLNSHQPRWDLTSRLKLFFSDRVRDELGAGNAQRRMETSLPRQFESWDAFSQAQYLESAHLLPGYILSSQGDRMAMAHSVEGRFPFLDHRVVAFASRLPARLKMNVLNEKYLLKVAVKGLIPETIRTRSKQPYLAPEGKCFFGSKRAPYVDELLSARSIQNNDIFQSRAVEQLVQKFKNGLAIGVKDNMALVGILSTQLLLNPYATT